MWENVAMKMKRHAYAGADVFGSWNVRKRCDEENGMLMPLPTYFACGMWNGNDRWEMQLADLLGFTCKRMDWS